jgi:glucose/arabinose dehydrogenase
VRPRPPRDLFRTGKATVAALAMAAAAVSAGCGAQSASSGSSRAPTAIATETANATATPSRARSGFARVALRVPAANRAFGAGHTLRLPRGWRAEVWALVPSARLETWTPGGDLLVSQPSGGSITELLPRARRSQPPLGRTLVSGLTNPQGMAFDKFRGHEVLYVAESDELDRYVWTHGGVGARTVVIGNLPGDGAHGMKNVVVGVHHTVYVDIGSATNASPPTPTSGFPRASVLAYNPTTRRVSVFATGIRNGDGLSIAPDGTLWTAVNERDDIAYPFRRAYGSTATAYGQVITAYVDNHPADEVARLTAGRNVGWPFCDPDPDVKPGRAGTAEDYGNMRLDADVQTNSGERQLNCRKLPRIDRGLPAHSAPLGFHFLKGSSLPAPWNAGAVVAVHGSWDRQPPRAPAVLWLPWENGSHTLGTAITLVGGFQAPNGSRWGRTVDAVPGPDGALYVSDDQAGAIYRIVPARRS